MSRYEPPFEIHVHSQLVLRAEVGLDQVQEALRPILHYAGARSLADGAKSLYEEEPGIVFDAQQHLLQFCWTLGGDEDFRQTLDELCMNLNELCAQGAAIEISYYDAQYDDEDEDEPPREEEAKDDYFVLFVGPNPSAIMAVQRDLLVQDVVSVMERHFDGAELGGVVAEIDRLFAERFDALSNSLELGRPPRNPNGGHGGGRRPRHLH